MTHKVEQIILNDSINIKDNVNINNQTIFEYIADKSNKSIVFGSGPNVRRLLYELPVGNNNYISFANNCNNTGMLNNNDMLINTKNINLFVEEVSMVKYKNKIYFTKDSNIVNSKIFYEISEKRLIFVEDLVKNGKKNKTISIPVEISAYAYYHIKNILTDKNHLKSQLKMHGGSPYVTEHKNYVIYLEIDNENTDLRELIKDIKNITGVIEVGLFETKGQTQMIDVGK